MQILYIPDKTCIELKSLKLYLQQYRMVGVFYEELTNKILDDLVAACSPRWMRVESRWNPRGGISTTVTVEHKKTDRAQPPAA
jgi:7-cyano-7-deazaguanine reductase